MDDNERKKLRETLAKADEQMIREIIREAESFLEDQLKAGLASDARAMTLAGFLSAMISVLIAATGLMVAAKIGIWPHIIPLGILFACLCVALFATIRVARPVEWFYRGNNPRFWASDIENKKSLQDALVGQAALYANGITENRNVLGENQRYTRVALWTAASGAIAGGVIEGFLLFLQAGRGV